MEARLLDNLVCPLCKGPLTHHKAKKELVCYADRLAFPIRDDIPIMWVDQARTLTAEEAESRT
ncbi:Trm112 family protein [Undibacterium squillarum]|uniref:UPF0434 protein GCM10010946_23090 n=1 Tax=Undibacterium squillarum TaxID=1131567 RepID=A0ABQ2XYS0_9BURK|nr:Trm112 family protein [Undibacterium squillarum]GGX43947.1 UPF0434 protein [Undibacterium squillarum]